ncbi:MAG: hypothetical protein LBB10_01770 [Bifidobacteriaceae bacterium]|jgi:hypothetical protein|nr:hypothetical protein [Bifidobacteriaceae bacterium]
MMPVIIRGLKILKPNEACVFTLTNGKQKTNDLLGNLLVVLCGNKETQPVVNSGT